MSTIKQIIVDKIRSMYASGKDVFEIRDAMEGDISLQTVRRICGDGNMRGLRARPYIEDEGMRKKVIEELASTKGKSYLDILYMGYLKGDTSNTEYQSAVMARNIFEEARREANALQKKREWGE